MSVLTSQDHDASAIASSLPQPAGAPVVTMRHAALDDAEPVHALIQSHLVEGHLLPRSLGELRTRMSRFLVLDDGAGVVGCAELAPLSRLVAEVRSLVVARAYRGRGLGAAIVSELGEWATREGYATLCAFAHEPTTFVRLGFSIVPHVWLPEKIAKDCRTCARFRHCGQHAVALSLGPTGGGTRRVRSSVQPPHAALTAPPAPRSVAAR